MENLPGEINSERVFALILTNHRMWGPLFIPYMLTREKGKTYFRPEECLSPFASPETTSILSEEENTLIDIINSYSERNLHRLFSREPNVVSFLEKVSDETFEKHIKPYIENKLSWCIELIRTNSIPVYRQKSRTMNLHDDDRLEMTDEHAIPVFSFGVTDEGASYQLSLIVDEKPVPIRGKDISILSNSPCVVRIDNSLLLVDDIEGTKLKPFFLKDSLSVPRNHLEKYMRGFVLNIVNRNRVIAEGFDIVQGNPSHNAELVLEMGIRNIPVLILEFRYDEKVFHLPDKTGLYTVLSIKEGKYLFTQNPRDREWERNRRDSLIELGFFSDDDINFMVPSRGGSPQDELYSLLEAVGNSWEAIKSAGFRVRTGSLNKKYLLGPVDLSVDYTVHNDWFDLKAYVIIDNHRIPFVRFRRNILENNREYTLPDGRVVVLPEEWFTKYKDIFELGKPGEESLQIHKQHFTLLNEVFSDVECRACENLEKLVLPETIPSVTIPEGLDVVLRQYQADGLSWLCFLQSHNLGGCLADDMGLGKTIQTLSLLQYNKESAEGKYTDHSAVAGRRKTEQAAGRKTSLLVVPASLLYNWENEIKRFAPGLKVYSYKGNQRKKTTSYFGSWDIILSSYHTVRQDAEIIESFRFHYIILDESQVIKNPASQLYKTMIRLHSEFRLVLTGTPVENSLVDLWTQLNFLNPGLLGSLAFFKREFARPIEKNGADEKEQRLQKLIKPFILRRTKEEVATDLPQVMEKTVFCDMTDEQTRVYNEEKSAVRNSLLNNFDNLGPENSAIIVLQGLMKLRQISNHPVLADQDYRSGSGKFENVLQDIESVIAGDHKILVFSSFVKHLNLFANHFTSNGTRFAMLTGSSTNREKIVNEFQDDPHTWLFLISLKAGGVGLNLTAADYVFILDPWWNPSAELQALNRAHRIGQDRNVFVYRYISTGSIEEKITRLQEKKSKLAETFISSNNPVKDLNINEMLELIG